LFLFVADGLSKLINSKVQSGNLQELKVCRRAPGISHLLFADDTLLFFKANPTQAEVVKYVLEVFARGTGQLINPAKCSIMFKGEENEGDHAAVKQILAVEHTVLDEKYLGLPTPRGRIKGDRLQTLKERLSKRLQDYSEKHMSLVAKEMLIKAVAQSIPTYIMSVFKLPLGLCDDLSSIIRQFWWGVENGRRKMAWIAWKDMISKK
jgi:hypothetical protein